jgi:integrase
MSKGKSKHTGIVVRHQRGCPAGEDRDATCSCKPSFRAEVFDVRSSRKVRKTFSPREHGTAALSAARSWRRDALADAARGKLPVPSRRTLAEEAAAWQARAESGEALTRSGRPYKPAVIRGVESDFRLHISPEIGALRLSELRRVDVQALVDRLRASGLSGSKVRGIVVSFKIVLRRPLEDDEISTDPCSRLRLPEAAGSRDRSATVDEVEQLIRALPAALQPLYWTAALAGPRRGELRGLRWEDVSLAKGEITIRRSWDSKEGEIAPKSRSGSRVVPMPPPLRDVLADLKARSGRDGADFVFPGRDGGPFTPTNVWRQADAAWTKANAAEVRKAKQERREPVLLDPIGLHELRHVWVSLMFDAGFSLEEIAAFAGHSSTWMTERYKHLLPGAAASAGERFGEYLQRANTAARIAQIAGQEQD